ncbi:MAG TPA: NAD(P)-dependent oxidoreductase [Chloroflexota bacterium]|jgi:D-lactate dehydrogenase
MGLQRLPLVLYSDATPAEITAVRSGLPQATIVPMALPLREGSPVPAEAAVAEVLSIGMASRVEWTTLQQFPRLRLLAVRSAGVSQVDLDACAEAGVSVCNVPHFGDPTVAEHTFALLLALSRRLLLPYQPSATHGAAHWRGWDLAGKTLGIVGLGHIGRHVAQLGRTFGMTVLAYDVQPDVAAAESSRLRLRSASDLQHWARPVDQQELQETIQCLPLDELLRRADVITLHAPYARQTRHLIDAGAIASMRRGAVLINTARGGLIDLTAVRAALDSGQLGGVGLDVMEGDELLLLDEAGTDAGPVQPRQAWLQSYADLLQRPNVVISPHNAYNSGEAMQRILATTIETIQAYLAGHAVNVVDLTSWG